MTLTKDTPLPEQEDTHPSDPHQTGSGSSSSPGGSKAPDSDSQSLTAGQEGYPGDRPAGEQAPSGMSSESAQ